MQQATDMPSSLQVLDIWLCTLRKVVLEDNAGETAKDKNMMHISEAQLVEVIEMLHDVNSIFEEVHGPTHISISDIHFALGLSLMYMGDNNAAYRSIQASKAGYSMNETKFALYFEAMNKLGIPDLSM